MCSDLRSIGVSVRGVILSLVVVLLCIVGRQGQAVDANAGAVGPVLDPAQQAWLAAYGPVTFGVVEAGWPPYDSVTADGSWVSHEGCKVWRSQQFCTCITPYRTR